MVIDDGFDLALPVFQGKVRGAYTVECRAQPAGAGAGASTDVDGGPDGGVDDGGAMAVDAVPSFQDTKAALLAQLATPDQACGLRAGIARRPNPFADLEGKRVEWNRAIRDDRGLPRDAPFDELIKRLNHTSFHGTATAGVVAYDNPGLGLVLVEQRLQSRDEAEAAFTCFNQEPVDEAVALFSDPDVRRAYVGRPVSSLERDLIAAMSQHEIGIVNESFGALSRRALEALQKAKGCQPIALGRYFALFAELDRARDEARPGPRVLVVKAAGNDGAQLDRAEDSIECWLGHPGRLLVGSYGLGGASSDFSNFGACVDAYAPGERVIAPLPGDWLFPLAGTSFSSPLVARLLSLTSPEPFDAATARTAALALREPNGDLRPSRFPQALSYDPSSRGRALTLDEPRADPMRWIPDTTELDRVSWPIRWLERRRTGSRQ